MPNPIDEANGWLMGAGVPSCSFLNLGDTHEGRIMAVEMGVQRDLATGKPKLWDDGSPMKQMIVTLATDERDATIENDDGSRKLYIASKGMREALSAAVKKSGAHGLAVGGMLGMRYVRDGVPSQRGFNPPKEYVAKYEPPVVAVDDGYDSPVGASVPTQAPAHAEPDISEYPDDPF